MTVSDVKKKKNIYIYMYIHMCDIMKFGNLQSLVWVLTTPETGSCELHWGEKNDEKKEKNTLRLHLGYVGTYIGTEHLLYQDTLDTSWGDFFVHFFLYELCVIREKVMT